MNKVTRIANLYPTLAQPIAIALLCYLTPFIISNNYPITTSLITISATYLYQEYSKKNQSIELSQIFSFIWADDKKCHNKNKAWLIAARNYSYVILGGCSFSFGYLSKAFLNYCINNTELLTVCIIVHGGHHLMFHILEDGFDLTCFREAGKNMKNWLKKFSTNLKINKSAFEIIINGIRTEDILNLDSKVKSKHPLSSEMPQPPTLGG